MYWKAFYINCDGHHQSKRFDTEEELDAWLTQMEADDKETQVWKKKEEGGEIHNLQEIYPIPEINDLPEQTVLVYKTPVPKGNPLLSFTVESVTYLLPEEKKENEYGPFYKITGKTADEDKENETHEVVFHLSGNCLSLLLAEKPWGFFFEEPTRCWATPVDERSRTLLPDTAQVLCLRTEKQVRKYNEKKEETRRFVRVQNAAKKLPVHASVYRTADQESGWKTYFKVQPEPESLLRPRTDGIVWPTYKVRPENFESDLAGLRVWAERIRRRFFTDPGDAPFIQPSLFDNIQESNTYPHA